MPTPDVLSELSERRRPGQTLVGFAAEHGPEGAERARGKLARKALDAIVFNDISRADIGFDTEENKVTIVSPAGERRVASPGRRRWRPPSSISSRNCVPPRSPEPQPWPRRRRPSERLRARTATGPRFERRLRPVPAWQALLADRHWQQAVVSLEKAKRLEPDKTSIREALGRGRISTPGATATRHVSSLRWWSARR